VSTFLDMTTPRSRSFLAAAVSGALVLAACGGSDDSSSSGGDICAELQRIADIGVAGDAATTDAEISSALQDFADAMQDVAAAAPDEIKADAEKFAEASAVLAGIQEGQDDLTEEQAAVIADEDTAKAADAVSAYASSECGIELD
jgi:exoribonuclease R